LNFRPVHVAVSRLEILRVAVPVLFEDREISSTNFCDSVYMGEFRNEKSSQPGSRKEDALRVHLFFQLTSSPPQRLVDVSWMSALGNREIDGYEFPEWKIVFRINNRGISSETNHSPTNYWLP